MQKLSVKENEKWFSQLPHSKATGETVDPDIVSSLKAEAQNLLDAESHVFRKLKEYQRDKDFLWIKQILQGGTLADKVSAHTLLIQESAVYNLSSLETLIGMVNTKGKRECLMAMNTLLTLFSGELLVEGRKLKPFHERALKEISALSKDTPVLRKRILILWAFEDKLKSLYKRFLTNLEAVSHDTIEKTKMNAITVMSKLLVDFCEEEQFLLERVVNKIGDPVPKVGSLVCHQLSSLLSHHTQMNAIVVQEVERFIFRPNLSDRAKYYALCFLTQVILSHDEFKLANHLIMIYFGQFKLCVKKGEVNTKMMSALLTGVSRAYPYAQLKNNVIIEQLDAMYRLVHMVSFNISVQAMMLIFQVLDASDSVSDRFYGVLYRKLFDPELSSSSRQASVLNLVYRALKKDVAVVRVKAFVKRLLQVALYQAPNLQCGILILISELNKIHPGLLDVKYSFEPDSESDEHYEDAPSEDEGSVEVKLKETKKPASSWIHKQPSRKNKKSAYNFDCRNPLHANTDSQGFWELLFLKQSFHPSVALFAHQIANSTTIKYSGDPLLDFTTSRFLDRFVYRNPKKPSESFQSDPKFKIFGARKFREGTLKKVPVISQQFLQQKEERVPVEERFIYQYLQSRRPQGQNKSKDDFDMESVCSEDFQKLLDEIHPEDEGKDGLNFAKELGLHKLKKSSKRRAASDSSEEENLDDVDGDFELDDKELDDAFETLDENNFDICEEDFIDGDFESEMPPKKKSKMADGLTDDMMIDVDTFSSLLEENAGSKIDSISSEAFKTNDRTSAKQIEWEMQRSRPFRSKRRKASKKHSKR